MLLPTCRISKTFEFSASHQLRGLRDDHPCARLHGHNYVVTVRLHGRPDARGFVFDYGDLAPVKAWIDGTLDHRHLNDVMPDALNPTAEVLATFIGVETARILRPIVGPEGFEPLELQIEVSETPKTTATTPFYALDDWKME